MTTSSSTSSSSKNNSEAQQPGGTASANHRLSLPLQSLASNVTNPTGYRSSLGGFINVGNMSVPISVASAVFNGTPVYNSPGIPVLLTFGPAGLNITNAMTTSSTATSNNNSTGYNSRSVTAAAAGRPKQADASRSTPRLTPASAGAANNVVMNRSMSWINAVHMSTNRLSPGPGGVVGAAAVSQGAPAKSISSRFGSSHQMAIGSSPYGPSREAHGPGIHNPNQGGRGHVFASRGSRGSLSTNRVTPTSTVTPSCVSSVVHGGAMRSVSGSLTTMREDGEDLKCRMGFSEMSPDISPMPASLAIRLQNHTPISLSPSSLSSLAPSPPPILQNGALNAANMRMMEHHKSSVMTLASQSTLSFHTSSMAVNNPIVSGGAVMRRNHAAANTIGASMTLRPEPSNQSIFFLHF